MSSSSTASPRPNSALSKWAISATTKIQRPCVLLAGIPFSPTCPFSQGPKTHE
eukprot:m.626640 g.626640  ORF g.626640 m.626640 type:complete len:53 (-) comp58245_c0_seq2:514-672(-)